MAPPLTLTPDLDAFPWTDLAPLAPLTEVVISRVGVLSNGTASGRPAIEFIIDTPTGPVLGQLTYAQWRTMVVGINASPHMRQALADEGF